MLGIVQGATEFLPISSSGHLILTSTAFGWNDQGLGFDVGLHLGTLFVVVAYFRHDWLSMAKSTFRDIAVGRSGLGVSQPTQLLLMICGATLPAGVVGLVFGDRINASLREPWVVATSLGVVGVMMWVADRAAPLRRNIQEVGGRDALVVGMAQALALVPGVSRSGITLVAGMGRGLTRGDAARFGFLLGTPTIAGAALVEFPSVASQGKDGMWRLLLGMVVSAVVGLLVVSQPLSSAYPALDGRARRRGTRRAMRFLQSRTLVPFAVYRICLAAVVLGVLGLGSVVKG